MAKAIKIQQRKSNHFEVRMKTEITKDYTIALITVVNVSEWTETPSLNAREKRSFKRRIWKIENLQLMKTQREEIEVYRIGFQDIQKASEMYEMIVKMVEATNRFWVSHSEMLEDWLRK